MKWLKWVFTKLFKRSSSLPNIIVVGIDTPSYRLAQTLQAAKLANIIAFIDDEPWSNRTEILGSTVRYPSDLLALIERWKVIRVIEFNGNLLLSDDLRVECEQNNAMVVQISSSVSLDEAVSLFNSSFESH